jgi:hypothetical protein
MTDEVCRAYIRCMRQPPLENAFRVPGGGGTDLAVVGALVAGPARCTMLPALDDRLTLPASRLAAEAGGSPATAGSHPRELTEDRAAEPR